MIRKPKRGTGSVVAQSNIFQVERCQLTFSNGAEREFEYLSSRGHGSVMVIPVIGDEIILIEEYAVGIDDYELGFVKGLVDEGESLEQAANRELQEEVGYAAVKLTLIREAFVAPHYNQLGTHIFVAHGLTPSILEGDEPEPLRQQRLAICDLKNLLKNPRMRDARSLYAVAQLALEPHLLDFE